MPGSSQSHHGLGYQKRDRAKTPLCTTEGSSANGNIARVLKKGARGLELPAPKQWNWDLTPLLLCSTDSRQDRTDEQKRDQTPVFQD